MWEGNELPQDRREVATRYPKSTVEPPHCYPSGIDGEGGGKIDRLSQLPNELLDFIFDVAYTEDHPPSGPISKLLRHWYNIGLYRRIKFQKDSTIAEFVRHINSQPDSRLPRLVESISLDDSRPTGDDFDPITRFELAEFFGKLTRLESLDLGDDEIDVFQTLLQDISPISSTNLPSLRKLRVPEVIAIEELFRFHTLTSLSYSATSYDRPNLPEPDLQQLNPLPLTQLTHLTIGGENVYRSFTVDFCSYCPDLSHLRLDPCAHEAAQYKYILQELSSRLKHLELLNFTDDCYSKDEQIDDLLPRFTQLEHLTLGHYIYSYNLPVNLSQLKCLRTLVLWPGQFSIPDFLPLISGPTRLPLLRKLVLNLFEYKKGTQLDSDADGNVVEGTLLSNEFQNEMWFEAEFPFDEEIGFTKEGIEEVIQTAEEQGIEVEGSIFDAFRIHQLWLLEMSNYLVYRSWKSKDLRWIEHFRQENPDLAGRFPPREYLQSLAPNRLKLVRTELPEEEWFALSLVNDSCPESGVGKKEEDETTQEEESKEEEPEEDSSEDSEESSESSD